MHIFSPDENHLSQTILTTLGMIWLLFCAWFFPSDILRANLGVSGVYSYSQWGASALDIYSALYIIHASHFSVSCYTTEKLMQPSTLTPYMRTLISFFSPIEVFHVIPNQLYFAPSQRYERVGKMIQAKRWRKISANPLIVQRSEKRAGKNSAVFGPRIMKERD